MRIQQKIRYSNIGTCTFLLLFTVAFNFKVLSQASSSGGSSSSPALKEVQFDLSNNLLLWNGTTNVAPCIEGFNLRIVNAPTFSTTTKFTINIYESIGGIKDSIVSCYRFKEKNTTNQSKIDEKILQDIKAVGFNFGKIDSIVDLYKANLTKRLRYSKHATLNSRIKIGALRKKYITYGSDNKSINTVTVTGLQFKRYYFIEVIMGDTVLKPEINPLSASENKIVVKFGGRRKETTTITNNYSTENNEKNPNKTIDVLNSISVATTKRYNCFGKEKMKSPRLTIIVSTQTNTVSQLASLAANKPSNDTGNSPSKSPKSSKIDTTTTSTSTTNVISIAGASKVETNTIIVTTVSTHTVSSDSPGKKDANVADAKMSKKMVSENVPFYSTATKKELVYFEFFGAVGGVTFFDNNYKHSQANGAIATGVKFRYWPTSTNSNYRNPYKLYPRMSHFSFVLGAVINNLSYESTSIGGVSIGIKPLIALDYEPCNIVGFTAGVVLGKQDQKNAFNTKTNLVAGVWLGVSFSFEVFQLFKSNVPGINLPSISGGQAASN